MRSVGSKDDRKGGMKKEEEMTELMIEGEWQVMERWGGGGQKTDEK